MTTPIRTEDTLCWNLLDTEPAPRITGQVLLLDQWGKYWLAYARFSGRNNTGRFLGFYSFPPGARNAQKFDPAALVAWAPLPCGNAITFDIIARKGGDA